MLQIRLPVRPVFLLYLFGITADNKNMGYYKNMFMVIFISTEVKQ